MHLAAPHTQTRYLLRSRVEREGIVVPEPDPLPQRKRKQKHRIEKLMDLSNDCLLEIIENADISALSHIADTCDRLCDLTRYVFRLKYTRFNFISLFANGPIRMSAAKWLLEFFGDLIVSLNIVYSTFAAKENLVDKLLSLVQRCCKNLKELTLEDFVITNESSSVLDEITNLVLANCEIRCNNLDAMLNLKSLSLSNCHCRSILRKMFANLEELQITKAESIYSDELAHFLTINRKLKRVSIIRCYDVSSKVLQCIDQLKELEEFEFQLNSNARTHANFQNDLVHLAQVKTLKVLKLNCHTFSVSQMMDKFVTNGVKIEVLELANGPIDDATYENINKLKSIKVLKLNEMTGLNDVRILGFGKQLELLEQLHIKVQANVTPCSIKTLLRTAGKLSCLKIDVPFFHLNFNMYKEMLNIIQKRDPLVKLTLSIYGDGHQFTSAGAQNEIWFAVKYLNRDYNRIFETPATSGDNFFDELSDDDFEDEGEDDMFMDENGWETEEEEEVDDDFDEVDGFDVFAYPTM